MSEKFFEHDQAEFLARFQQLIWITYCRRFKPLLIEVDHWLGKKVDSLKTDNTWGCTVRCVQMLLANALMRSSLEIPKRA